MNQPLKELIHETVENSHTFKQDLKEVIQNINITNKSPDEMHADFECDFEITDYDANIAVEELLQFIADFVNQNYTFKPNKI